MKTKILTQKDFDKELAKVIYSHPAVMTDDLLEEISDRIAQLFALGYHNNLKINVIADKNGFCVATFGGLASILTLVYPGKLTCKKISLRRLLAVVMDDFTQPQVNGINFGAHGDDDDEVGSFFIPKKKLLREVSRR